MEKEEYKQKLSDIKIKYDKEKEQLYKEYALSNNTVKVGDKFIDHIGTIIVEKIGVTLNFLDNFPSCIYYGTELKKDGTPTKKMTKRWAHQCNQIK